MSSTKRVLSNLIQQDCYVRAATAARDLCSVRRPKVYVSLDEVSTDDGVSRRYTENDYPITPESVASYAESCNYKTDVLGNIARFRGGVNLGDVREIQDIVNMDSAAAAKFYSELAARFSVASAVASAASSEKVSSEPVVSKNNQGGDL